ncbi:Rv2175c family DNA-binding protein [Microbacterium sp.]|uniref:Rv2175c family DNA-binding protein n=1 Tax=Microbacterium sp. TaxID=51671 RepID=UPI0039E6E71A
MTDDTAAPPVDDREWADDREWLTLPDLVEVLGEPLGRVRRLFDEKHLIGSRRTGTFAVPAVFLQDGRPIAALRGTVFVLHDAGFSDDEAIDWLLADEESIGQAPIAALRQGRKSEVRRVAQTLA